MASLLTGATGFIGRHLLERLLARDGEIQSWCAARHSSARARCSPQIALASLLRGVHW